MLGICPGAQGVPEVVPEGCDDEDCADDVCEFDVELGFALVAVDPEGEFVALDPDGEFVAVDPEAFGAVLATHGAVAPPGTLV